MAPMHHKSRFPDPELLYPDPRHCSRQRRTQDTHGKVADSKGVFSDHLDVTATSASLQFEKTPLENSSLAPAIGASPRFSGSSVAVPQLVSQASSSNIPRPMDAKRPQSYVHIDDFEDKKLHWLNSPMNTDISSSLAAATPLVTAASSVGISPVRPISSSGMSPLTDARLTELHKLHPHMQHMLSEMERLEQDNLELQRKKQVAQALNKDAEAKLASGSCHLANTEMRAAQLQQHAAWLRNSLAQCEERLHREKSLSTSAAKARAVLKADVDELEAALQKQTDKWHYLAHQRDELIARVEATVRRALDSENAMKEVQEVLKEALLNTGDADPCNEEVNLMTPRDLLVALRRRFVARYELRKQQQSRTSNLEATHVDVLPVLREEVELRKSLMQDEHESVLLLQSKVQSMQDWLTESTSSADNLRKTDPLHFGITPCKNAVLDNESRRPSKKVEGLMATPVALDNKLRLLQQDCIQLHQRQQRFRSTITGLVGIQSH